MIWVAFTIALIGSYTFYNPSDFSYAGFPLLTKHILDILGVLLIFLIASAVGRLFLDRIDLLPDQPIEALIFSIAIGLGVISNLILLLSLVGALQKSYLCILFLTMALITSNQIRYILTLTRSALSSLRADNVSRLIIYISLISTIGAALFMLIFALAPPVDWDTLMYHSQLPKMFLEAKRMYVPEDNLAVSYIGMAHMLYLPLLAVGNISGPAMVSMFMAILLGISCFSLSKRYFGHATAWLSLSLLWGTTAILLVAVSARIDVTLCFYTLLAHFALYNAIFTESTPRYYYLSAILFGLAFGTKYSGLVYVASISPLIIWGAFRHTDGILISLKRLMIFNFLFGLIMLPWMAKNSLLLGTPLYPFFSKRMLDPWLVSFFGTETIPSYINQNIFKVISSAIAPFNLWDTFVAPGLPNAPAEGVHYYPNPLLLGVPLCLFFIKKRPLIWLVIPALLYLLFLWILHPILNLRYLLPIAAPLTIAVAYGLTWLIERLLSKRIAPILIFLFIAIGLIPTVRTAHFWLSKTKALNHAVGVISSEEYLAEYKMGGIQDFAPVINFLNENLPKDSYILMLFEARGFYFKPRIIQDNKAANWPLLLQSLTPAECLESVGVTHVLVNYGALNYYLKRGANQSILRFEEFHRFANQCLTPIYKTNSHTLFEVKKGYLKDK